MTHRIDTSCTYGWPTSFTNIADTLLLVAYVLQQSNPRTKEKYETEFTLDSTGRKNNRKDDVFVANQVSGIDTKKRTHDENGQHEN